MRKLALSEISSKAGTWLFLEWRRDVKKIIQNIIVSIFWLGVLHPQFLHPQLLRAQTVEKPIAFGFIDKNKDGINDRFCDANGDGVNDIDLQSYQHIFQFRDQNQDGLNDLWQDKDGDGVNDLMVQLLKERGIRPKLPWIDRDGDGVLDPGVKPEFAVELTEFVLDSNKDQKNDITGLTFTKDNIMGYRYGCIDEDLNKEIKRFEDANGDGMHDNFNNRWLKEQGDVPGRNHDYFIDTDGDGIADGRGFGRQGKATSEPQRKGKNR
jgi:hypothetical protein